MRIRYKSIYIDLSLVSDRTTVHRHDLDVDSLVADRHRWHRRVAGDAGGGAGPRADRRGHSHWNSRRRDRCRITGRHGDGGGRQHQPVAHRRHHIQRRLHGARAAPGRLPGAGQRGRLQAAHARRHPPGHGRDDPAGSDSGGRRRQRGNHDHRRRGPAAQRLVGPWPRRRSPSHRRPAAERPQLHHTGRSGARRGPAPAASGGAPPHQRRAAAHQ